MRWLVIAAALTIGGCSSCDDGSPVPFGLDARTPEPEGSSEDEPEDGADGRPAEGRSFPEGTRRVDVEGAPIELETAIRGLWAHDVDGDGDRDGVLLVEGDPTESPLRVVFAQRDGASFRPPRELGRAPAAEEGCAVQRARLGTVGPWLLAAGNVTCEEGGGGQTYFVLSTDGTVRLQEQIGTIATDDPGVMRLVFGVDDVDEDGRDDLTVEVELIHHDVEDRINLHWLDRPSGLARREEEPNRTLTEKSREALRQLRADPEAAIEASRAVLRLHRALCREPGEARILVGNARGIECGESGGAGRAITTVVRGHAARGELLQALDAFVEMDRPGQLINEERRVYARRALASIPSTGEVILTEGPPVSVPASHPHALSALGFLDEDHLLVRGSPPQRWTVGGSLEPADPGAADLRVLDPQKRYAVAGLESACGATRLRIVAASALRPSLAGGSEGIVATSRPALYGDAEGCEEGWRSGAEGWHLLGWAPQGIVAARGGELRVAPLDVSARPSGEPRTLEPSTPPPAPLPAGRSTLDGRFRVELRGPGVLVHASGRSSEPTLLWPEGWGEREGAPSHPAVSPSGRRVALVQNGRIVLLEQGAAD